MSVRTVFAPVPKNKNRPQGAPPKVYTVNMAFMREFNGVRVDPNLQAVMNNTSSSISMTISAQGNTEMRLVDSQNSVVADVNDIKKVMNMNSFINAERKSAIKAENSSVFRNFLFALNQKATEDNKGPIEDLSIPVGFHDVFRTVKAALAIFDQNVTALESLQDLSDEDQVALKYIQVLHRRTRNAGAAFLLAKFKNYEDERKFSDFLYQRHVPAYCFQKLSKDKLSVNSPGFGPWKIFFPRDPAKGFCLTYKEMCDVDFFLDQGEIIEGMFIMRQFLLNQDFVKIFCNIYTDDSTEESKIMESFSNVPMQVPIPPKFVDIEEIVTYTAKAGGRFPGWTMATSIMPKENLRYLGTVFKRLQYFAFPYANKRVSLFKSVIPDEFSFDPQERKDLLSQFAEKVRDIKDHSNYPRLAAWYDIDEYKSVTAEWCVDTLSAMLGISPLDEEQYTTVKNTVGSDDYPAKIKQVKSMKVSTQVPIQEPTSSEEANPEKVQELSAQSATGKKAEVKEEKEFPPHVDSEVKYGAKIPKTIPGPRTHLRAEALDQYQPIVNAAKACGANNATVTEFVKKYYDGTERKKKRKELLIQQVRSPLSREAVVTLGRIKKRNTELEKPISDWFRTFMSTKVQSAVATLLLTHFEFAFESPITYGKSDWAAIGIIPQFMEDEEPVNGDTADEEEVDGEVHNEDDEY